MLGLSEWFKVSLVTHTPLVLKKTLEDETQNVLYSIHDVAFLFIFPGGGGGGGGGSVTCN